MVDQRSPYLHICKSSKGANETYWRYLWDMFAKP